MSNVLLGEILGMFRKTLTTEGKYSIEDWENFQLRIQMQLFEKRKPFPQLFLPLLESTSNLRHFETKDNGHS